MLERWRLGDYEFRVNPNRAGQRIQMVGDTVKTLDGTVISQPSFAKKTYSLESKFYQHRERVIEEVSIVGDAIEAKGEFIYTFNFQDKIVRRLNKSLSEETILATLTTPLPVSFDVTTLQDGTPVFWTVEDGAPNKIHKFDETGTLSQSIVVDSAGTVRGIKVVDDGIWVINSSSELYKVDMSGNNLKYTELPFISYSEVGYKGMTIEGDYIIVSYTNDGHSGAYHVNMDNGNTVNHFGLKIDAEVQDIAIDGDKYLMTFNDGIMRSTKGNTLMLDMYNLERNIRNYGFVDLVDDMGVRVRVYVSDYSIDREEGNLHKYSVSINATKVDRGVNL
jgi:hypothetical protein